MSKARPRPGPSRELEPWQDPAVSPFLRILGVTKQFGDVYAVDDLETWAERGAVTSTSDPRGSVLPAKRQPPTTDRVAGRFAR